MNINTAISMLVGLAKHNDASFSMTLMDLLCLQVILISRSGDQTKREMVRTLQVAHARGVFIITSMFDVTIIG